jgi:purine-nucleoside phosphorylase
VITGAGSPNTPGPIEAVASDCRTTEPGSGCMTDPIHLQPTAPLAERVLLPGDPGRALWLAQELLETPAMFNHHRGLWGYTGVAADGEPLTIQSTGMGGPSTAIVVAELIDLGARRLLRVGTCGALADDLALGDIVIATEAIATDGTSRALGGRERIAADAGLLASLLATRGEHSHAGPVASTDLFYDTPPADEEEWIAAGALAVEMETATLYALAAKRGLAAASLLIVSDTLLPARVRISPDELRDAERRMGAAAVRALAASAGRAPAVSGQC